MSKNKIKALLDDIRFTDPERYRLVEEVRALVLKLDDSVTEELKYGGLLYSTGKAFCGIFSYSQHVSLEFGEGAQLGDMYQVLEGIGKHRRHIKLRSPDDLANKRVSHYLGLVYQRANQP